MGTKTLRWWEAIFAAFFDRPLDHFPRFRDFDRSVGFSAEDIVAQIDGALDKLAPPKDEDQQKLLNALISHGREALDEVKELTEYQDQKSTRLLTIATFLSAVSGLLFKGFVDAHPLDEIEGWPIIWAILTHGAFAAFITSTVFGALVIFHATRIRFKYPKLNPADLSETRTPKSFLFYPRIIEVQPGAWARAFLDAGGTQPNPKLSVEFAKNYIVESYLVAAKVADKLRYLERAQDMLAFALRALIVWLALLSVSSLLLPRVEAPRPPIELHLPDGVVLRAAPP